jgi:tungstate transport system ATP-binding protein
VPRPDSESALPLVFEKVCVDAGGARRLHQISCRLEAGSLSVLLGPNGAGKSLCLRLAAGLLRAAEGSVRWHGPHPAAGSTAIVLQRPVLLRRSVRANLAYPLRLQGVPREEAEERIARVLSATRLSELAERPARRLSVGEQQRVALAQAWVRQPAVLLLDEPAAALDPGATGALEAAVQALRADDVKVVMSTHDLGQARRMADEVLFLHRGRLLEQTPAASFFEEPRSPEGRKFLAGEILG